MQSSRLALLILPLVTLGLMVPPLRAESVDASTQVRLREATFEVVLGKPDVDPLTYDKELPLGLLPFAERTSKFRPIGTAFCIERDRFITAAHVIDAGGDGQYGPLALRDAAGNIYPVDRVLKYSVAEDYAEFTVQRPPKIKPLDTRAHPELNEAVFAVGNALGEGIIVRDGLYVSDTPEESEGRWKWLRFSAAASPGNSGGPLVDRKGRVIGVILRKSPSENLNVAVGIDQVMRGSSDFAVIQRRFPYHLPTMLSADTADMNERFALPVPIAGFYAALTAANEAAVQRVREHYLANHAAQVFPLGEGSLPLLYSVQSAVFPRSAEEREDGKWGVSDVKPALARLDHNGFLEMAAIKGYEYIRLRAPDDTAPPALYADTKRFMDVLLKGVVSRRQVGSDSVRVTSMGAAAQESDFTDAYGRGWQLRSWRMPFNDSVMLSLSLLTPQGFVAITRQCPAAQAGIVTSEMQGLTGFFYVSFEATLKQWQEYLAQPLQPEVMHSIVLAFDYGRQLRYQSPRFKAVIADSVEHVQPDTLLSLKFNYFVDGGKTVWDVGAITVSDGQQKGNWIDIMRQPRPPASLPEGFADRWQRISTASHPYTATAYSVNGGTQIEAVANAKQLTASQSPVAYTVAIRSEGTVDGPLMKRKLDTADAVLNVLER